MKTQTNKEWALKALLEEVSEEHEIVTRVFELRKLIKSTNDMDLSKYEEPLSFGLKQALLNGYILINSKDINVDKLDEAIENINHFLKAMGELK
jgi:translation elongation factor EF-1beta